MLVTPLRYDWAYDRSQNCFKADTEKDKENLIFLFEIVLLYENVNKFV